MRPTEQSIPPRTQSAPARPKTAEEWEQVRRSVAMLPTESWALTREQALEALTCLVTSTRTPDAGT